MAQRDYPHIALEDYLLIDEQSTHTHNVSFSIDNLYQGMNLGAKCAKK